VFEPREDGWLLLRRRLLPRTPFFFVRRVTIPTHIGGRHGSLARNDTDIR
jgi:hypothetical protein